MSVRLEAVLPWNREAEGTILAYDAAEAVVGPSRARGEADNTAAAAASNVQEDPRRAFGDHPFGLYRVVHVAWHPSPADSYGPAFLALDPIDGEALTAKQNGRAGLGIHGGRLGGGGILRATYGCLRVEDAVAEALGLLVTRELEAGRPVFYRCRPEEETA